MSQTSFHAREDAGCNTHRFRAWNGFTLIEMVVVIAIIGILVALLLSSLRCQTQEAARRSECKNNLKQIAIAFHNYHAEYGTFPPAYIAGENGKPMHSWRVLLLPFLDQKELYEQYRFDEPWNGPHNSQLAERIPFVFRCPSFSHHREHAGTHDHDDAVMSPYLVMLGKGCAFNGPKAVSLEKISDEKSSTLLVVETVANPVHWMKPQDVKQEEFFRQLSELEDKHFSHSEGTHVLLADGRVRFLSRDIKRKTLEALSSINGGEAVEDF